MVASKKPPGEAWRVLVVEDEYYIADDIRRALAEQGAEIVGPVSTVARSLALVAATAGLDAAVLDVKLGDDQVWPVVDALRARGVDYVFATGYGGAEIPAAYEGAALFRKPVDIKALLRRLLERRK